MARVNIHIATQGMRAMENDFGLLASPAPIDDAKARMSTLAELAATSAQSVIPVDDGDYRRPAGTLRDSARWSISNETADYWEFSFTVGTNDDAAPYAKWVLYKGLAAGRGDYLEPLDAMESRIEEAMNQAFDDVFGTGE
ncbi:hypothetical protein [uncultured Jatrophihabitans sp.]|uniref:hypothetical protein n=1 Tax=uncultured Jatrophihabitans sp. TaxID=1610747 RepID=UPI0035CADB3B